jgi:hypothetical protein
MRIDLEVDGFSDVAGGQFTDECGTVNKYYIQFKDVFITMNSEDLKKMAVAAINHLMVNDHEFEFRFTNFGQKEVVPLS